ncbi:hypothetical protein V6N11_042655 [Hibiscus sabdariffa]|uniref:Uncharacterized protein n=1 Tax=Hibiscus sabdariffa TaxID=183260 RepID=A0ABR2QXI0_9ROSI
MEEEMVVLVGSVRFPLHQHCFLQISHSCESMQLAKRPAAIKAVVSNLPIQRPLFKTTTGFRFILINAGFKNIERLDFSSALENAIEMRLVPEAGTEMELELAVVADGMLFEIVVLRLYMNNQLRIRS